MAAVIAVSAISEAVILMVWILLLRDHRQQQAAWTVERRELLNRIQRPEMIPASTFEAFEVPEPEPDFSHLVGTIAELKEDVE